MGSRTRRTDFQPWVLGFRFWRAKGFYLGLHFFFTQGPSSAAVSQNHHLYLVLLLLLLPGASWLESHGLLCQSPPCYADFLLRPYLELPGVAGYWSQKLGCAAKGTWLPWVFLSRGGFPGMWSHVLPHLQATSLFQLEKKCGSIKLIHKTPFVRERPCMWLGSLFSFRTLFLQVGTWNWPISNSWNLSKC